MRDRQGEFSKLREPAVQSVVSIIISARQFASTSRTRRLDSDVVKVLVEDRPALGARQPGGDSLANQLVRQFEKVDDVQWQIPLIETLIERFGLAERSGKSVKDEPPAIADPFPNDPQGQFV